MLTGKCVFSNILIGSKSEVLLFFLKKIIFFLLVFFIENVGPGAFF